MHERLDREVQKGAERMKINIEADVFDDPEYCNVSSYKCTKLLFDKVGEAAAAMCFLFSDLLDKKTFNFEPGPGDIYFERAEKCDECKTAYQAALKEKEIPECPNCNRECGTDLLACCPFCDFEFSF